MSIINTHHNVIRSANVRIYADKNHDAFASNMHLAILPITYILYYIAYAFNFTSQFTHVSPATLKLHVAYFDIF